MQSTVRVVVLRGGVTTVLSLCPQRWSGRGLLGYVLFRRSSRSNIGNGCIWSKIGLILSYFVGGEGVLFILRHTYFIEHLWQSNLIRRKCPIRTCRLQFPAIFQNFPLVFIAYHVVSISSVYIRCNIVLPT